MAGRCHPGGPACHEGDADCRKGRSRPRGGPAGNAENPEPPDYHHAGNPARLLPESARRGGRGADQRRHRARELGNRNDKDDHRGAPDPDRQPGDVRHHPRRPQYAGRRNPGRSGCEDRPKPHDGPQGDRGVPQGRNIPSWYRLHRCSNGHPSSRAGGNTAVSPVAGHAPGRGGGAPAQGARHRGVHPAHRRDHPLPRRACRPHGVGPFPLFPVPVARFLFHAVPLHPALGGAAPQLYDCRNQGHRAHDREFHPGPRHRGRHLLHHPFSRPDRPALLRRRRERPGERPRASMPRRPSPPAGSSR